MDMALEIGLGVAAIASGLAIGASGLGSGVGQGIVTRAAAQESEEDPSFFGKGLLLSVLPQTPVIFGLVIAILILINSQLF